MIINNINISSSNNYYKKTAQKAILKNNISFRSNIESNTLQIKGSQTTAKVFTQNIDEQTKAQFTLICSHPVFKDLTVRIMPDTHAGKSVPVGFTAPIGKNGEIIPSLISGDIGCGMLCCEIDTNGDEIDFKKLDEIIRTYIASSHPKFPTSLNTHIKAIKKALEEICNYKLKTSTDKMIAGLGTLGRGNHFIEIDKSNNGKTYLLIHSGSRNFGKKVFTHHQNIAMQQNPYRIPELSYLTSDEAKEYLQDMQLAQKYAQLNRRIIADEIIKHMGWKEVSSFESIHNYIGEDNIIRKGAISARAGQKVIIPLNMKDGAIIAVGQGNQDWNNSAPHGAGRKFSRLQAARNIQLQDYKASMNGIYTSCICPETIDEAPAAYKDSKGIESDIKPTVKLLNKILPKYNFKDKK